jgi:hypothetical protein
MNETLRLNREFHFTVSKTNQCNLMLVDLLAHMILMKQWRSQLSFHAISNVLETS